MGAVEDAAALIGRRLDDLEAERGKLEKAERGKLEKALVELGGTGRPDASGPKPKRRSRGGRRGPTRKEQVLAAVMANPAIRTSEIAQALGIGATQVSNLLGKLKKEGVLRKDRRSKRWVLRS